MRNYLILLLISCSFFSCKWGNKETEDQYLNKGTLPTGEAFFTTPDSVKLHYKISGAGVPVLYIHGGPGQGFDSFEQMKGNNLEKKLTMIYFDQRGSGRSASASSYHMDNMLADIEALRTHLGVKKFYLLAHSFGGIIASAYALKYPEHTAGIILANCTLHFFNEETIREQMGFVDALLNRPARNVVVNKDSLLSIFMGLRQDLSAKNLGYRFITDDVHSIIKMEEIDALHPRNVDFGTQVITKPNSYPEYYKDYAPLTAQIKVPALVITGQDDHAVGTAHYKTFRFPDQTTAVLAGGHLLYYENNDAFTKAVWGFVESNSKI